MSNVHASRVIISVCFKIMDQNVAFFFCLLDRTNILYIVNECSRESCFQLELILCDKVESLLALPIQIHSLQNVTDH